MLAILPFLFSESCHDYVARFYMLLGAKIDSFFACETFLMMGQGVYTFDMFSLRKNGS